MTKRDEGVRRQVIHMSNLRKNVFGGLTTGTACNRMRVLSDGMNLTDKPAEVTCKFCLRVLASYGVRVVREQP